jgi:hemerythrin superfamily protein
MPNGIDLILIDHQVVASLFEDFEETGQAAYIGQIIDQLAAHDDAEQQALYPLAALVLDDADLLDQAVAAHAAVKLQIDHLRSLEGQPFLDEVAVLKQMVEAHVADEEERLLPALQEAATDAQLDELGGRILQAKQRVG